MLRIGPLLAMYPNSLGSLSGITRISLRRERRVNKKIRRSIMRRGNIGDITKTGNIIKKNIIRRKKLRNPRRSMSRNNPRRK